MLIVDWGLRVLSASQHLLANLPGFAWFDISTSPQLHKQHLGVAPISSGSDFKSQPSKSWHKYVRASSSRTVAPARVHSRYTAGNVTDAEALVKGNGITTLTRYNVSDAVPTVVIDFGQNTVGLLNIDFNGSTNHSAGRPGIRLAYSETLQFLSDTSDFSRSYNGESITPGSDQVAVQAKRYNWLNQHGCQYGHKVCSDGLHGFRYLKIYLDALPEDSPYATPYGSVSISSISLQLSAFHGSPETFTGWFESSDKDLNQWWYDSVYTNDLCTDTFRKNDSEPRNAYSPSLDGKLVLHDGPKRDRDPYVGDLAVASRTSYLTHNVSIATRNVLADLADHQRSDGWIPPASIQGYSLPLLDYPMYWVICSYDYVLHTGDIEYIEEYYHVLLKVLDEYYPSITNKTTHLITKGINNSNGYGDYAFLPRTGAVTYYNALYVLALKNAAFIATHLNRTKDANRWTDRSAVVTSAINALRFDNYAGAFFDGDCSNENSSFQPCKTYAQDGNSLAIVSGVVDGNTSRARSILDHLSSYHARPYGNAFYSNDLLGTDFSQRVYAFISYFEIEARFLAGDAKSALEEIRRLYGWMATHDPGVTVWEGIGKGGVPYEDGFTSMSHGWSTGVVPLLTNHILGVKAVGVAFERWSVRPVTGDVQWARGVVPTPFGDIEVSWERKGGGIYMIVNAPDGTSGVVDMPVDDDGDIVKLDDVTIWTSGGVNSVEILRNGRVSVEIGSGTHSISVSSREKDEV